MNFELNEDQAALAESLSRLLADRYGFEKRRALTASGAAHDEKTWAGLAELGLTALPVPEALGGFGGGARDLLPAMQAFGRSLSMEPFLASAVLAASTRPAPTSEGSSEASGRAAATSACLSRSGVSSGWACRARAAAPDTTAGAIDVPLPCR